MFAPSPLDELTARSEASLAYDLSAEIPVCNWYKSRGAGHILLG
jgi:hypothetical protein